MSSTSTLDPDFIGGTDRQLGTGHDNDALGPGDSSDSGSDVSGLTPAGIDTDSNGTGERGSVDPDLSRSNRDIGVDRVARMDEMLDEDDADDNRIDADGRAVLEADAGDDDSGSPEDHPSRPLDFDKDQTEDGKLGLEADGEGYAEDLDTDGEEA